MLFKFIRSIRKETQFSPLSSKRRTSGEMPIGRGEEPLHSDKEQAAIDEFIKKLGDTMPEELRKATELDIPSDKEIEKIQEYIKKL